MSNLITRTALPDDCAELALTLRQADLTEIALSGSPSPYETLMRGLAYSDICESIIAPSGAVVGMAGVVRMGPQFGCPWMLAADALTGVKWPFLRACRDRLMEVHSQYPNLFNHVWEGNTTHIKWLRWLGFTMADKPLDRPNFLPFWKNTHVRANRDSHCTRRS